MSTVDDVKSRALHEILVITKGMLVMQTQGIDVAVPYWRGAPGIAKTSLAAEMCNKGDMNFVGTHYPLKPIEEVSGLPVFTDIEVNGEIKKGTSWTLPDILTEITKISANGKTTLWLLDDFHLASPAMMQLGYEMFTEWKLRGFEIPKNVAFLLAGNFSAKAGSKKNLTSAVANRCAIFPVHMDFEFWKTNFALVNGINSKIISFLTNQKYRKFFQEEEQLDRPWASARSWTRFSRLLTPMEDNLKSVPHQDVLYFANAHLGDAAASEFTTYYKLFSEVKTKEIFDGSVQVSAPSSLSQQFVYTLANVSEFIDRFSKSKSDKRNQHVDTMAKVICAVARQSSEIAVTGLKEIALTEQSLKLRDVYFRVKNAIRMRDGDVAERLEVDIQQI